MAKSTVIKSSIKSKHNLAYCLININSLFQLMMVFYLTGRQFYKCANNVCNFFLWAPDPNASTSFQNSQIQNSTFATNQISCNCGQPAAKRTVSKAGPNTGREFYCCPKPQNEGCRFFKWAEEVMFC